MSKDKSKRGINKSTVAIFLLLIVTIINTLGGVIFTGISLYTIFSLALLNLIFILVFGGWMIYNQLEVIFSHKELIVKIVELSKDNNGVLNILQQAKNDYILVPKVVIDENCNTEKEIDLFENEFQKGD